MVSKKGSQTGHLGHKHVSLLFFPTLRDGPGTEPELEAGTVFPNTERGTGTVRTAFQEPTPEPEPSSVCNEYCNTEKALPQNCWLHKPCFKPLFKLDRVIFSDFKRVGLKSAELHCGGPQETARRPRRWRPRRPWRSGVPGINGVRGH